MLQCFPPNHFDSTPLRPPRVASRPASIVATTPVSIRRNKICHGGAPHAMMGTELPLTHQLAFVFIRIDYLIF